MPHIKTTLYLKIAFILLLSTLISCSKVKTADLIVTNAIIWTGNENQKTAQAMAIDADTIVAIGTIEEINKYKGKKTKTVDAYGRFITPGFIEALRKVVGLNDALEVGVYSPYADHFKDQIIVDCVDLGVPYKLTWTCYNPVKENGFFSPCLECEACKERESNGLEVGVLDIKDYCLKDNSFKSQFVCGTAGELLNQFRADEDKQDILALGTNE